MDTDAPTTELSQATEEAVPAKVDRPSPIVLTSATNLVQLMKQLKCVAKQAFEFRNTRNGTRVITKGMVDFQAVKLHFESNNLSFFTKSEESIKTVILHLPINTPVEDIAEELGELGFDVVSVKQLLTTRRSLEETPVTFFFFSCNFTQNNKIPRTIQTV
jgi:hypothetical protein